MAELVDAVDSGDLARVRRLVEHGGADVNDADNDGWKPLRVAACEGHVDVARLLVDWGADVNPALTEEDGMRPLHAAAYIFWYFFNLSLFSMESSKVVMVSLPERGDLHTLTQRKKRKERVQGEGKSSLPPEIPSLPPPSQHPSLISRQRESSSTFHHREYMFSQFVRLSLSPDLPRR